MAHADRPVLLCFASVSWDYLWQRHQELMARFARAGYRVLFVEPIGIRMPKWEDRHRIWARLRQRRQARGRSAREKMQNVWIVDPLIIPFQNIAFLHRRNVRNLTYQLRRALEQIGGGAPIIWTYVPTPLALAVIQQLTHRLLVYDCVDALTLNPKGVFQSYAASEARLSQLADLVFVASHKLYERQHALNPHTYLVTHGVEYDQFALPPLSAPADLAALAAPRLVFFGGIDERIDLELIAHLARQQRAWSIVLLGIVRTAVSHLRALPNVHFLGPKPHDALPAYLHHCDVLLLPYRRIAFNQYIHPAKLYECLAVGKPIVAMRLPCFDEFSAVLSIADSPEEFARAVETALRAGNDPAQLEKRRAVARANSWDARFQEIHARLAERLV